ncbi:hypothetical protein TorRG33x02_279840 [Trema orientale]|uniref:Uncharacterized protein n=1 Tax=Trema orientale TaxID=63057 RepID=A0A2P5CMC9_TREOI|nr:hypothetical protein TorRG33x02_279840 [Trema orientale]
MKLYRLGIIWPNYLFLGRPAWCPWCKEEEEETSIPVSWMCTYAVQTWLSSSIWTKLSKFHGFTFGRLCVFCWSLCGTRDKFVFENHVTTPLRILECATRVLVNYREVGEVSSPISGTLSSDKSFLLVIAS